MSGRARTKRLELDSHRKTIFPGGRMKPLVVGLLAAVALTACNSSPAEPAAAPPTSTPTPAPLKVTDKLEPGGGVETLMEVKDVQVTDKKIDEGFDLEPGHNAISVVCAADP